MHVSLPLPKTELPFLLGNSRLGIVDPWYWLEPSGQPWRVRVGQPALPASWEVTSDSIAAWLAEGLGAGELVLLKSSEPTLPTPSEWATSGYVDAYFLEASANLPVVRAVSLCSF